MALLALLRERPLHTREVAKLRHRASYDATHAALARLEKRGFVTGIRRAEGGTYGREGLWDLTNRGRRLTDG